MQLSALYHLGHCGAHMKDSCLTCEVYMRNVTTSVCDKSSHDAALTTFTEHSTTKVQNVLHSAVLGKIF